jgi:hypothetical protein
MACFLMGASLEVQLLHREAPTSLCDEPAAVWMSLELDEPPEPPEEPWGWRRWRVWPAFSVVRPSLLSPPPSS